MPDWHDPFNPKGVLLQPVDNNPHDVSLVPVDEHPFQSDPYTAAQPPAGFRDPLGPVITKAATDFFGGPGRAAAPNPYPPGSEEWESYEQSRSSGMSKWGAETAKQMIGGGTSFAARSALGTGGGAARTPLESLENKLRNLLEEHNRSVAAVAKRDIEPPPSALNSMYAPMQERGVPSIIQRGSICGRRLIICLPPHLPKNQPMPRIISAGSFPETAAPEPYPSIFDAPQQSPYQQLGQEVSGSKLFQTNPDAMALFDQHIAPHYMHEQEFADHFFAGHHSPDMEMDNVGGTLDFGGHLVDPRSGKPIGTISRQIDTEAGTAHHGYLKINPSAQGTGLAKDLLRNQMDLYQTMGLKSVDLFADIDVGSYAWAKYGFLPSHEGEWNAISQVARRRLSEISANELSSKDADAVRQVLMRKDPQAIWDLADMKLKLRSGEPVSKRLLMNNSWNGKLDLNDPEAMERFNAYVGKKK